MTAFAQLRIVEIEGSVAGAYCAKLFADNGAAVSVLGGSEATEARLTRAERIYLHHNKEVLGGSAPGVLDDADVIIESSSTGPLGPPVAGPTRAVRAQGPSGP